MQKAPLDAYDWNASGPKNCSCSPSLSCSFLSLCLSLFSSGWLSSLSWRLSICKWCISGEEMLLMIYLHLALIYANVSFSVFVSFFFFLFLFVPACFPCLLNLTVNSEKKKKKQKRLQRNLLSFRRARFGFFNFSCTSRKIIMAFSSHFYLHFVISYRQIKTRSDATQSIHSFIRSFVRYGMLCLPVTTLKYLI